MKKSSAWPKRYRVNRRSNSYCVVPLKSLDWDNWFTDGSDGELYLHVHSKDGETIYRVGCRHTWRPRLKCKAGSLWWLVDKPSIERT